MSACVPVVTVKDCKSLVFSLTPLCSHRFFTGWNIHITLLNIALHSPLRNFDSKQRSCVSKPQQQLMS